MYIANINKSKHAINVPMMKNTNGAWPHCSMYLHQLPEARLAGVEEVTGVVQHDHLC